MRIKECPNKSMHTEHPTGYVAYHDWAKELLSERDALQSEVERLRDTLDQARFKCTMLAGRTTYSPEQFENGRYVCGELAEEIKRVLVRREACISEGE